jgi:hypothetical protein
MSGSDHAKVLLATFGTLGDIYPFIAIAKAIAACGLSPSSGRRRCTARPIESEAIGYTPIRPDIGDICNALGTDLPGMYRIMLGNPHFILDEIYAALPARDLRGRSPRSKRHDSNPDSEPACRRSSRSGEDPAAMRAR